MTGELSDRDFTDRAVKKLARASTPAGLQTALLAAYDGWNASRGGRLRSSWKTGVRFVVDIVWPGAPVWVPASALAAALLLGAGLGILLPAMMSRQPQAFSLEQPSSFSLLSSDMMQEGF